MLSGERLQLCVGPRRKRLASVENHDAVAQALCLTHHVRAEEDRAAFVTHPLDADDSVDVSTVQVELRVKRDAMVFLVKSLSMGLLTAFAGL